MCAVPARTVYLDYPRADDHLPDGDPIGLHEMVELTGRTRQAVEKWFERGLLPLADGPSVWGRPTWRRRTFLAWASRRGFTVDRFGVALPVQQEADGWTWKVPLEATTAWKDCEGYQPAELVNGPLHGLA